MDELDPFQVAELRELVRGQAIDADGIHDTASSHLLLNYTDTVNDYVWIYYTNCHLKGRPIAYINAIKPMVAFQNSRK
jgi:hypothetical protein